MLQLCFFPREGIARPKFGTGRAQRIGRGHGGIFTTEAQRAQSSDEKKWGFLA
jgi:hypothetical protein